MSFIFSRQDGEVQWRVKRDIIGMCYWTSQVPCREVKNTHLTIIMIECKHFEKLQEKE